MIKAKCPKCGCEKFLVHYEGDEEERGKNTTIEKISGGLCAKAGYLTIICKNCNWGHAFYLGE
jgi:predicted  nucleic acid-binding Zn-ribbon protein